LQKVGKPLANQLEPLLDGIEIMLGQRSLISDKA